MQLSPVDVDSINISDPEFWKASREVRESTFATLRREAPIKFTPITFDFPETGKIVS